jgi:hypothetical protein
MPPPLQIQNTAFKNMYVLLPVANIPRIFLHCFIHWRLTNGRVSIGPILQCPCCSKTLYRDGKYINNCKFIDEYICQCLTRIRYADVIPKRLVKSISTLAWNSFNSDKHTNIWHCDGEIITYTRILTLSRICVIAWG